MNTKQLEKARALIAKHNEKMHEMTTVRSPVNGTKVAQFVQSSSNNFTIELHNSVLYLQTLELIIKKAKAYQRYLDKQKAKGR